MLKKYATQVTKLEIDLVQAKQELGDALNQVHELTRAMTENQKEGHLSTDPSDVQQHNTPNTIKNKVKNYLSHKLMKKPGDKKDKE